MRVSRFDLILCLVWATIFYFFQTNSIPNHDFTQSATPSPSIRLQGSKFIHLDESCIFTANSIPIIYRDEYNIRLRGLEKNHPFDTEKYLHIVEHLESNGVLTRDQLLSPKMTDESLILTVHTIEYLEKLKNPKYIAKVAEMPILSTVPLRILEEGMLNPMKYGIGGTLLAAEVAMKIGWSINLSGGYHHARASNGGGWSYFNDIMIAIKNGSAKKVMVIDLDAHQGDGIESLKSIVGKSVYIFDMYNRDVYPNANLEKTLIDLKIEVSTGISDEKYLEILENGLETAFKTFEPEIIYYNAGSDVLKGDPLGKMSLSPNGMIKRDELVWKSALIRKIPIVYLLSGGYQKTNAQVIARSIQNILAYLSRRKVMK